mgnify:FL=1
MDNLEKEIEELIEEFQNLEVYKQYIAIRNQEKNNLEFLKLKEDARIAKQEIRKYVSDSVKLKEQIDKAKNLEEEYSNHPLIINEKVYKEELLELIDPLFDMLK